MAAGSMGGAKRALWLSFAVLATLAIAPAAAQAGAGVSATPVFPATATVGNQNLPAAFILANANSAPDSVLTLCNANDFGQCAGSEGIALTPSCGGQDATAVCNASDPGVFNVDNNAVGAAGTACAGVTFTVAVINASTGKVRFTPASGSVTLPTSGSACRIDFTIDVLKLPTIDARPAVAGMQTVQIPETSGISDQNNLAFGRGTASSVTIKASPGIVTKASPSVSVGGQISDSATLVNAVMPTSGSITFNLYGPNDADCAGPILFTSTVPVSADGNAASAPYAPTADGTYRWVAIYSGDAQNSPVTGLCNAADEQVTVTPKATPPLPPATQGVSSSPTAPGTARITGKTGCATQNFNVTVSGGPIRRVVFSLDGKPVLTLRTPNRGRSFVLRVKPGTLSRGRHRILARTTFTTASGTSPRDLRLVFQRCSRAARAPVFTG